MAPEVIVTETCKDDPYDYKVIVILIVLSITAIKLLILLFGVDVMSAWR